MVHANPEDAAAAELLRKRLWAREDRKRKKENGEPVGVAALSEDAAAAERLRKKLWARKDTKRKKEAAAQAKQAATLRAEAEHEEWVVARKERQATASRGLIPATPQQLLAVEVAAAVAQLEALARQSQTITASREALAQVNAARQVLLAAPASAPAPAPAPAPASAPAAPLSTDPQAIYLPLGVTDAQRAKIEENLHTSTDGSN
jgi:hypothetical protein